MAEDKMTDEMKALLGLTDEDGVEIRLHPILSNVEVLEARGRARSKVLAEQKKRAMKSVEEEETRRLQREEGLTTGATIMDEIVNFTVDVPSFVPGLSVNMTEGLTYYHGHTYQVPRHVANSLAEMQGRAWALEDEVQGRSKAEHYGVKRGKAINARTGAESENRQMVYDA